MAKKKILTEEDDALLAELGIEYEASEVVVVGAREERIIAGFAEIQKFVEEYGRLPEHGEDKDIFERMYAVRLDQIRQQAECRDLLKDLDYQNLLLVDNMPATGISNDIDDDELLAQLGVEEDEENSITHLRHV